MSDQAAIRFIGDMQRLEVKPGDRFVIMVTNVITAEQRERIAAAWSSFVAGLDPAPPLLILDGGASLNLIGRDHLEG